MPILIILAGSAIGWYVWSTIGGNLAQSPEDLVNSMQQNMIDVESAYFTSSLSFEGLYDSSSVPNWEILLADATNENKKQEGVFMADMSGAFTQDINGDYKGYVDMVIGYEVDKNMGSVAFSIRALNKSSYIQLNKLNIPMEGDNAQMLDIVSDIVIGKWTVLAEKETNESMNIDEEIKGLIGQRTFLKDLKKEATEKLRDEKTIHISAKINRDDVRTFVIESRDLSDSVMTIEEKNDMERVLDRFEDLDINIWIGISDKLLYKIQVEGPVIDEEYGIDGNFNIMFEMYDFGKAIQVDVPQEMLTFDQLVEQVMGAVMFGMMGERPMDVLDGEMTTSNTHLE